MYRKRKFRKASFKARVTLEAVKERESAVKLPAEIDRLILLLVGTVSEERRAKFKEVVALKKCESVQQVQEEIVLYFTGNGAQIQISAARDFRNAFLPNTSSRPRYLDGIPREIVEDKSPSKPARRQKKKNAAETRTVAVTKREEPCTSKPKGNQDQTSAVTENERALVIASLKKGREAMGSRLLSVKTKIPEHRLSNVILPTLVEQHLLDCCDSPMGKRFELHK